jgi:hypothetical protein
VGSIVLTKGSWLLLGMVGGSNTVNSSFVSVVLSTTIDSGVGTFLGDAPGNGNNTGVYLPVSQSILVAATTTYYINAYRSGTFSENFGNSGQLKATRIA